ncbi:MAG: hypothetical protein KGL46_07235 [Hyphomicrobiales bacterium]|nr:hypothetical protein [Hyphomicrobiales bacterium]
MSLAATLSPAADRPKLRFGFSGAIALSLALSAALTFDHARAVWRTGTFYDTDDAMRMAQVRDLLSGQSWFDMTADRMDPPAGVFMHWSRIVDAPLALLIKFFGLFMSPAHAEAATRLAFPFLLLAALYALIGWASGALTDGRARAAGAMLAMASGAVFGQFIPGRIDHHAPQIVLLAAMTGATLTAFNPSRALFAAAAGAAAALSLAISLENLPFIAILAAAPVAIWIAYGDDYAPALRFYGLGLAGALLMTYGATVGPERWGVRACDALSFAQLAPALTGAIGVFALSFLRVGGPIARTGAALVAAAAAAGVFHGVAPQCLGDPFVGLDPLVRHIWLAHVAEVKSLREFAAGSPWAALGMAAPTALGVCISAWLAVRASGIARARFVLLCALLTTGFAMTFWAIRVFSSVGPLVALAGAALLAHVSCRVEGLSPAARIALATFAALPLSPLAYSIVTPADAAPSGGVNSMSCLTPQATAPLEALPVGLVLAPIDFGSHLIAQTHHGALAAPYHRNNHGNRIALDALMARPDAAQAIVQQSGANYVAVCPAMGQLRTIIAEAPQGLAATLVAGQTPGWLDKLDTSGPNLVFRVKR